MSLSGNLRTMPLPDILQWIEAGRKTGTLHVVRDSIEVKVVFREGAIFTSWSNDPRQSLGQFLMRDRRVGEAQLFKALLRQESEGRLIGSILASDGVITERELRATLKTKAEETIFSLFLWPEGGFEFKDGEFPDDVLIHLDLQVQAVVLEGIRRVDEWERIRKAFPSMRTTFKVKGAPLVEDPIERHALGLVAAGRNLAEISLEMHRSEFETAALLYDMLAREVVEVDHSEHPPTAVDPVAAIRDLLAVAYQRLQEKHWDAALKAYQEVLTIDNLNQHAKKGLIAVADARDRERVEHSIPRERIPVLTVDFTTLLREKFEPQEAFVISRINGQWDVQSILKICPMKEEEALAIFVRLLDRGVIELK